MEKRWCIKKNSTYQKVCRPPKCEDPKKCEQPYHFGIANPHSIQSELCCLQTAQGQHDSRVLVQGKGCELRWKDVCDGLGCTFQILTPLPAGTHDLLQLIDKEPFRSGGCVSCNVQVSITKSVNTGIYTLSLVRNGQVVRQTVVQATPSTDIPTCIQLNTIVDSSSPSIYTLQLTHTSTSDITCDTEVQNFVSLQSL